MIYLRKKGKNQTRTKQRRKRCTKVIQDHITPHENALCVRRNKKISRGIYKYTSNNEISEDVGFTVWQQDVSGKEHPPRSEDFKWCPVKD